MKRSLIVMLLLLAAPSVGSIFSTSAQTPAPQMPPKVLTISREEVKPYLDAEHENMETAWVKALAQAHGEVHSIAMTTMSGTNEAWFLFGYDSFAAFEQASREGERNPAVRAVQDRFMKLDHPLLSGTRGIIVTLDEELSYRPAINLAEVRYFWVETVHIRPGHSAEFREYRRILNAAHAKANIDEHWAVYYVEAGLLAGTVFVFHPLKSLKEVDQFPGMHGKAYADALGTENPKKMAELQAAYTLSAESNYFAINPAMSYPTKELIAADPAFWKPKPAAKPAAKKPSEKPGGGQ